MPTFPRYAEQLPECLKLFKPGHYLLLAYWIYFRPGAIKCYFHQAMPDLYNREQPIGFFRKWRTPAYQNLFVMMPLICLVLTVVLSGTVSILCAWKLDVVINWERWREGAMLGVALGMTLGMAFGMVGRVIGGVAQGTMVGTVYAVTVGVLGGVSLSVSLGVPFANIIDGVLVVGTIFGVLGGMAFTLDLEIGLALSLAFAVIAALSFGGEFILQRVFGLTLGALVARGMMSGAFVIGAFRFVFYPVQCLLAIGGLFRRKFHPVLWDELTVLPLPFTRVVMLNILRQDEKYGLRVLTEVGRNLFRRSALKAVLYRYVHKHPTPLRFLYELLQNPAMDEYLLIPLSHQDWEQYASVRHVLLGELALRPVEAMQHPRFRRSARWLNFRTRKQTPLTAFAGMLHDFLDQSRMQPEDFDVRSYEAIYKGILDEQDGEELLRSYECIADFLAYSHVAELPAAENLSSELSLNLFFEEAIRPAVLIALSLLGKVGREIARYLDSTNPQVRLMALAHATADLNEIHEYIMSEVLAPEKTLLQRIVHQWQQLILTAIGRFGKAESLPELQTAFHFAAHNIYEAEAPQNPPDSSQMELPLPESPDTPTLQHSKAVNVSLGSVKDAR